MAIPAQPYSPPSTLTGPIGQVLDTFQATADATPILIGPFYEEFGAGEGPRILLAPEPRGKVGPPLELGNVCSVTHSCDVLVRGVEDGTDLGRYDSAYAIGDKLLAALRRAGQGRLEFGDYMGKGPAGADAYGAELAFSFTYQRDVRWSGGVRAVAAAAADPSPAQPVLPPGTPASSGTVDATTNPQGSS